MERESGAETEKLVALRIYCSADMLPYGCFLGSEAAAAAVVSSLPPRR